MIRLAIAIESDIPEMQNVMICAQNNMSDKSMYVCDSIAHVKDIITTTGFGIVAYNSSMLIVGILLCRFPGNSEDNLGLDLSLDLECLLKVVHMESAAVLPEYQGNGLQGRMLRLAETISKEKGYRYALATAHPANLPSCASLESCGYDIILTKEKYGGLPRNIYMKVI